MRVHQTNHSLVCLFFVSILKIAYEKENKNKENVAATKLIPENICMKMFITSN